MRKQKLIVTGFLLLLFVVGVTAFILNRVHTTKGEKEFTITITSERDEFTKTLTCTSKLGTLGEYVHTIKDCSWEAQQYGTYIKGFYGLMEDMSQQYWWAVSIDQQQATTGVDLIPLESGKDYEFTLTHGW